MLGDATAMINPTTANAQLSIRTFFLPLLSEKKETIIWPIKDPKYGALE
jgi:hypothetical protein